MYRDLNLRIPEALYAKLDEEATQHGVSLESLCFALLSGQKQESNLVEPSFYESMTMEVLRTEIRKVIESDLPSQEIRKRVNALEFQISRRYIR